MTAFVGEGDDTSTYTGDFVAFNAPSQYWSDAMADNIPNSYKLWDGVTTAIGNTSSSPNNVWNSKSVGLSAPGVDVDTFNITWASGMLHEGDTSAHIDMYTEVDGWNLVYVILSFRSSVTGGALYLT